MRYRTPTFEASNADSKIRSRQPATALAWLASTVLATGSPAATVGPVGGTLDENDRSIGVLIQYGYFDFIWAGDLGGADDDAWCAYRDNDSKNLETPLAWALVDGPSKLLTDAGDSSAWTCTVP